MASSSGGRTSRVRSAGGSPASGPVSSLIISTPPSSAPKTWTLAGHRAASQCPSKQVVRWGGTPPTVGVSTGTVPPGSDSSRVGGVPRFAQTEQRGDGVRAGEARWTVGRAGPRCSQTEQTGDGGWSVRRAQACQGDVSPDKPPWDAPRRAHRDVERELRQGQDAAPTGL